MTCGGVNEGAVTHPASVFPHTLTSVLRVTWAWTVIIFRNAPPPAWLDVLTQPFRKLTLIAAVAMADPYYGRPIPAWSRCDTNPSAWFIAASFVVGNVLPPKLTPGAGSWSCGNPAGACPNVPGPPVPRVLEAVVVFPGPLPAGGGLYGGGVTGFVGRLAGACDPGTPGGRDCPVPVFPGVELPGIVAISPLFETVVLGEP
jgi:hypothetical protein